MHGPLILLSPAKTLNFEASLSVALAAAKPTAPRFPSQTSTLASALAKLSKANLKSMMSLSDNLAALNHERFADFDAQTPRMAIGAFEGMAYQTLDAPTLGKKELDYLQSNLRILCGMYGVLRPYDEIRPYRLEMSTKLSVGDAPNLYQFWGDSLTDSINAESPDWVLNVASAEYSKSIKMKSVTAPVITASFPGPAVYAKQARGEITRFCCERKVTKPEELRAFTGVNGAWAFVEGDSDATNLVFKRDASAEKKPAKASAKSKAEAEPAATSSKSRRKK